jgi:hypothetical protein
MTNLEIRTLIERTCSNLGGNIGIVWDGGQDGHYYFEDSSMMSNEEFTEKSSVIEKLSKKVNEYLAETNTQESDIWE